MIPFVVHLFLMEIRFIYPIIDFRDFIPKKTHKVSSPSWPYPDLSEFIRHFGKVKSDLSFGSQYARYFCDANNSIKIEEYEKIEKVKRVLGTSSIKIKKAYYFESPIESFYEIKFQIRYPKTNSVRLLSKNLYHIISTLLDLKVRVASFKNKTACKITTLQELGKSVGELYLYSTSRTDKRQKLKKWWIRAGEPL